ncbi:MAG: hypothetical protein ABJA02_05870 [Acidobacteriota bacterium]
MASKYDTNPLDPDFPEKARAAGAAADQRTQTLGYGDAGTQPFPYAAPTEEQTRRFASADVHAYSAPFASPYNGQYVPANYQTASLADMGRSSKRRVAKLGLSENIATALPYIPWYFGLVAGLLILLLLPRSETKVRFHAAQGLAAHAAILIVSAILGVVGNITPMAAFGNGIFNLAAFIMLLIFAVKAWRGKPVHIEAIDDLTNWFEEKIHPKSLKK